MFLKRVPSPFQLDKFVLFYYGQIKINKDTMNIYIRRKQKKKKKKKKNQNMYRYEFLLGY